MFTKRLLEFATKETHFLFKGNLYDQGFPLAPVLANLFMGHHEIIWLDKYGDSEVLFRGLILSYSINLLSSCLLKGCLHCLDSYRQRKISQPDCEITRNCGKNAIRVVQ